MSLSRNTLVKTLILTLLIGLIATCSILNHSLTPSKKAHSALPHIDISKLKINETIMYEGQFDHTFITKKYDGTFNVMSIPFWEGKYRLPEFDWTRQDYHAMIWFKTMGTNVWIIMMEIDLKRPFGGVT